MARFYARRINQTPNLRGGAQQLYDIEVATGAALVDKAVGVLAVLAILTATLVVLEVNLWPNIGFWQRCFFAAADLYALAAFYEVLGALKPGERWIITERSLVEAPSEAKGLGFDVRTHIAGMMLACVAANQRPTTRVANRTSAAISCVAFSVALAAIPLIAQAPHALVLTQVTQPQMSPSPSLESPEREHDPNRR